MGEVSFNLTRARSLPSSAHNHPAWWANGGHNHSGAWSDYGWLVDGVSLGEWIRFRKEEP